MSRRAEIIRQEIIRTGSTLRHHSMGSSTMRELMRGERLLYREDKAVKAEARREMQKILQERYEDPEGLRQFQLARCARKIEEGLGTLEDEAYIRKYAGRTRVLGSFEPQEYQHPQPVSIDVFLQTLPQVDQVDA